MSGLLGSIYSAGDRMKRKLGGLLQNPLETIALGSTRMAEDTNALSRLASEAGYMPNTVNRADQSVLVSEQQKALARALLADKGAEMGMAGTFIGPSAKTWDAAKAKQAKELLDKGVPPEQVWAQTGTFRGADGKLRQEISDHAATMPNFGKNQETKMHKVLDHQSLYDAYPAQQYTNVNITSESSLPPHLRKMLSKDATGSYSHGGDDLGDLIDITAYTPESGKSTALHELQHAIQQREGFGVGGSSQMAYQDPQAFNILKELRAKMSTPMPVEQYAKQAWGSDAVTPEIAAAYKKSYLPTTKVIPQAIDRSAQETAAKEYYRRLAGEAEARLTQSRMNMNPMQRAASYPPSMFDVPIEQQIVRFK